MHTLDLKDIILALIGGFAFGFAIFAVGASNYQSILKMLLLKDFKILKLMMTATMVGALGVFLFDKVIYVAPLALVRLIVGGLIFGVGFAVLGYCPGTSMVALGEGKKDVRFGILGGITGTAVFAAIYPAIESALIKPANLGKMTIQSAFGASDLVGLIILLVVFGATLVALEKFFPSKATTTVGSKSKSA